MRRFLDTTIDKDMILNGSSVGDFGPHIIARIENADVNLEQAFDMLDELPQKINMVPISRPYVIKSNKDTPDYISGVVLIAQSHIAFHYSVEEKTLFCDAFSCSFYKSEQFVKYLQSKYKGVEHMTLIRGSKHDIMINSRHAKVKDMSRWAINAATQGENK